jgi:galactonate dehydratase
MRITSIKSFHADGGWRPFSFLKLATDEGLIGWSEYSLGPWAPAISSVIDTLGNHVIGRDPRDFSVLRRELSALTRFAAGGLNSQAIAAIENACVDIAAKSAGLPVWQFFGGALRERLDLYWSHCGSFRARDTELFEELLGRAPLRKLEDVRDLGSEVVQRGFKAAKTNPIRFSSHGPELLNPGFVPRGLDHAGTVDPGTLRAIEEQVEAFRDGAGWATDLMLDVNFAFEPQSVARLERRLSNHGLRWLEYDHPFPAGLSRLRQGMTTPLASLEAIYETVGLKPFLDSDAIDVAIIDVLWNGFGEAVRMANQCHASSFNVAPHNFYGPVADLIAANFCAIVPNFEIMEIEADDVPWKYELLTVPPVISAGQFHLPTGVGWGADIDEVALVEHPWRPGK